MDGNAFESLESVSFNNCQNLDYVADNAFAFLENLRQVSFENSSLFYISGQVEFYYTV